MDFGVDLVLIRGVPVPSRVLPDKETLLEVALGVASAIAARSPVAVQGTKVNLLYSRDRPVSEGLHHVVGTKTPQKT